MKVDAVQILIPILLLAALVSFQAGFALADRMEPNWLQRHQDKRDPNWRSRRRTILGATGVWGGGLIAVVASLLLAAEGMNGSDAGYLVGVIFLATAVAGVGAGWDWQTNESGSVDLKMRLCALEDKVKALSDAVAASTPEQRPADPESQEPAGRKGRLSTLRAACVARWRRTMSRGR